MRSLLRNLLALLALLASFVAASTTVVHAAPQLPTGTIGIKVVDQPVDPADPRTQHYIVGNVSPGTPIQRHVRVSNNTGQSQMIDVYAGAASEWRGQFTTGERGTANRLTEWIRLDSQRLQLPSGQSGDVTVTITVPADAPVGTQYAGILAAQAVNGGVAAASEVGIRTYVTVGAGAGQIADFQIDRLTGERDPDGRAVVVADIRNTGTRALDLESELNLSGPANIGPMPSDRVLVPAGGAGKVRFRLPVGTDVSDGPWQARVTSRAASVVRELDGEVTFPTPDSGGNGSLGSLGSSGAGSSGSPLMWVGVAGAAAAAIGAIGWTMLQQQNPPAVR
ncbi:hypothetical protein LCL87_23595 [Rhodococcus hoagii]|nr:hypothetical protein [Prescottella equi]